MKVLLVNTVYGVGSTGRICAHLYEYAQKKGHIPYIGYGRKPAPIGINSYQIGNKADFLCHVLSNFFHGNSGFASTHVTKSFLRWVDKIQPDLIHLHNIHGFYLNIPLLFGYIKSKNIPVVWTLHDCWTFTGQCAHFDFIRCEKWKTHCQLCPQYRDAYPYSLFKDNSFQNYQDKQAAFSGVSDLMLVTPSQWLANLVSQSFLAEYPVTIIPTGIDTAVFCPKTDKVLPTPYILGVSNVWNERKGLSYFLALSNMLDSSITIVLIGLTKSQKSHIEKETNGKIKCITRTDNQKELASYYSGALAFINPTLEDTFPTTNLEALACGTPVITFRTGGSPEAVTENCGIVVDQRSVQALYEALLSLPVNNHICAEACRERALQYDRHLKYNQYIRLYESMVPGSSFSLLP